MKRLADFSVRASIGKGHGAAFFGLLGSVLTDCGRDIRTRAI
jgi:hypothetical protein